MTNQIIIILVLILTSAIFSCHGMVASGPIFNVMTFGAKPGTSKESTQAFIRAWDAACDFPGESTVLIPSGVYTLGETIFRGPCRSPSPITVQVQGTLQAVSDPSAYSGDGWITFDKVNGLIVSGGGTIDGQGQALWQYDDCKKNPNCVILASSIYMNNVNNVMVQDINLMNSMGFHMHITVSNLITIDNLTITAPGNSPNTDGIHISKSSTVTISNSVIKTGDDCVSIGQGSTNITINGITCGPGHGISVGSLGKEPNELDVKGLTVRNCTLLGTTNGIRIKTFAASEPSRASGMLFQDIIMDNVLNPIIIDQNYGTKSAKPSLVNIHDVVYRDIAGTTLSPVAVSLMCSSQVPCQNISLQNINLRFEGIGTATTAICANANVGFRGAQIPPPCKM